MTAGGTAARVGMRETARTAAGLLTGREIPGKLMDVLEAVGPAHSWEGGSSGRKRDLLSL